jgi:hypothetical protein
LDLRNGQQDRGEVALNKIARMDPAGRAELFAETANRLDIPESLIEKDFWVCWVLKQLFSIKQFSGRLLFKGGTSLTKVFGVINRFSEDIDLAVDYTMLGFIGLRDPTQQGLSKTKRSKLLSEMLLECQRYIGNEFRTVLRDRCADILGGYAGWNLTIDAQDPNIVRFQYPEGVRQRVAYVAPQVVLELGTHAEFVPRDDFVVRSFAATEFPDLFEEPDVPVTALLAKRTFWEKATLLHAEYHRAPEKPFPGRYSRHYYDVAMLAQSQVKEEALADIELLAHVIRHKEAFYPTAWARYALAVPGSLRLVPPDSRVAALKADYRGMAVMIFGRPPSFENVLETLAQLEREVNSLKSS